MSDYIKTIINGLKAWVTNSLNQLEENTSKLEKKINDVKAYAKKANSTANNAVNTANFATHTADSAVEIAKNKVSQVDPVFTGSFSQNRKEETTIGGCSHAEGCDTTASGQYSHAEGCDTTASGQYSHAEGRGTVASGQYSHAEGCGTVASGQYSHAEGYGTVASGYCSHVQGKFNIKEESSRYAYIVGNGSSYRPSNAHTLDWDGNAWFAGEVYVGSESGTNRDDGSDKLVKTSEMDTAVSEIKQELYEEVSYTSPSINLSDENYEYGYLSATGELTDAEPAEAAFRTANFIPVEGGRMLCWNADTSTVQSNTAKVVQYDASQNCIVEMADVPCEVNRWTSNGITLNADTKYVRVAFYTETAADLSAVKLNLFYHEDIEDAFADPGATFQYVAPGSYSHVVGEFIPPARIQSPLTGKKIVYDGDSICESRIGNDNVNLNNGGGYAKLIADRVSGRYENHAVGGSMLASWNGEDGIASRISELPTDGDLYCFEGGINDFWNGVPLGTDTYHEYEYGGITRDTLSVLGALDYIFYYATTHFVGKPICFVISHHIVDPDDTADYGDYTYQELHDAIVKVCKKWAIPYYDAYYTSGLCGKNEVQSNAYLTANASGTGDGCHPNEEGYKRYYVPQLIDLFERIMPVE